MALSYIFLQKFFQNLKSNVKRACIFLLILVDILSILILSVKNREWGEGFLNKQNPLSVTKVICRQSLKKSLYKAFGSSFWDIFYILFP